MDKSRPIIEFQNVSFSYNAQTVLEDVNFIINPKDSVSIVGPNGGGKTTLLKLLLGIIKPDKGNIYIFGEPPKKNNDRIGYMPQYLQYDRQFPVSVMDVVLMGRISKSFTTFYSQSDKKIVKKVLNDMKINELKHRSFSELSGGQQQRVLIARALSCEPELLLLDEPTANVDPAIESQFHEILSDLIQFITVITVSHDLGFVSQIVNRILCINKHARIHPSSEITGELISTLYGGNIKMIRHDHVCSEKGHFHE